MRRWIVGVVAAAALILGAPALSLRLAGTITTVAGTGVAGLTGNSGPAVAAEIGHPRGLATAPEGGFVFAEPFNATVRRVSPDGVLSAVAGTGAPGDSGDGGPAQSAQLRLPHAVAFTASGGLLIADTLNHRIRLVAADGTISTVAGTGVAGFAGDGGPAAAGQLDAPRGLAALPDGGFLIADTGNQRIRRVLPDGTITTVAGSSVRGFAGDGGAATSGALASPFGVAPTRDGGFLIADTGNDRIRGVGPDGTLATLAGSGVRGFAGDGGPATAASLNQPHAVAPLPDGGFLLADTDNNRIRRVGPDGTITTVVGDGASGFQGDGGDATSAELDQPKALAVLPSGQGFLIGDSGNNRVRLVELDLRPPLTVRLVGTPLATRTGRSAVLRYRLSKAAVVRAQVRRQARLVLGVRARGGAGVNVLAFGRRLRVGAYRVTLTATSADGRMARAATSLKVTS
jgi:NHL repeat